MTPLSSVRLTAALVVIALAMICAGFVFTMIAQSGFWLLLGFGLLGVVVFLQSFPWPALAAFVALDAAVAVLLRRFLRERHQSLPLIILILALLTLGGGFLLSRTPLYAGWRPPPPGPSDPLWRGYGAWRFHHLFSGTVSAVREGGYDLLGPDGQTFIVEATPGTEFPRGRDIAVGDGILIVGSINKNVIRAYGIRPFMPRGAVRPGD